MQVSLTKRHGIINNQRMIILTLFTFCFFIFTMIHRIDYSPLWGDEWVELSVSKLELLDGSMYAQIKETFQPPLYNWILHFWLKVGQSPFWIRFINVVFGFVSSCFLFLTIKKLLGHTIACISIIGLSSCYQYIFSVQEASEYTLMLMFLFITLYYFTDLCIKWKAFSLIMFVLGSVCSIWSQYGAAFVAIPLLIYIIIQTYIKERKEKRIIITIVYIIAFFLFACPLYYFFLNYQSSKQIKAEYISELSFKLLSDIPFILGRIVGYFFDHNSNRLLWGWIGVLLIGSILFFITGNRIENKKRGILVCLLATYVIHYFMVKLLIYGLVHPNQSYGFFCRYSYFYIPILAVAIPLLINEMIKWRGKYVFIQKAIVVIIGTLFMLVCASSLSHIYQNWHKSYGDIYSEYWIKNEGWNDVTYLDGAHTEKEVDYYLRVHNQIDEEKMRNILRSDEVKNLPGRFWIWRSNWGTRSNMNNIIDQANKEGYDIIMLHEEKSAIDTNLYYSLYYCTKGDAK